MSKNNKHIEFELVARAQAGDGSAFEELVKIHDRQVLNLAYSMLGNLADAQDVYQETFLRAWKSIASFRFQSAFKTWLLRIAVNQSLTARKRKKLRSFLSLNDTSPAAADVIEKALKDSSSATDALFSTETLQQINAAMERLSAKERAVFTLKHFQEFKIRDISEMLGYAEGTVKNLLFRAGRKMQKALKSYYKDDVHVLQ